MTIYTRQNGAATTNAQRVLRYKQRMTANGFRRLSIWVHPELLKLIIANRQSQECFGRILERLILGTSKKRHSDV